MSIPARMQPWRFHHMCASRPVSISWTRTLIPRMAPKALNYDLPVRSSPFSFTTENSRFTTSRNSLIPTDLAKGPARGVDKTHLGPLRPLVEIHFRRYSQGENANAEDSAVMQS